MVNTLTFLEGWVPMSIVSENFQQKNFDIILTSGMQLSQHHTQIIMQPVSFKRYLKGPKGKRIYCMWLAVSKSTYISREIAS